MQFNHCTIHFPQKKNAKYLIKILFISMLAIVISSCTGDSSTLPTLLPFPTGTAIAESVATEDGTSGYVTQEVDLTSMVAEEAVETPEVFNTAESVRYQTEDGSLFVVVTSVNTAETMDNLPEAPAGEKFLVLTTNIANLTGEPIFIEAASFTLIDQQFNRYAPVQPEDFLRTTIYGQELPGETTALGPIRFAIPEDAKPYLLEWCPYNDCDVEMLQTFLP